MGIVTALRNFEEWKLKNTDKSYLDFPLIAITGRMNAPDIWEISKVLGERCVVERIRKCL